MLTMPRLRPSGGLLFGLFVLGGLNATLAAQETAVPAEFQALYVDLTKPGLILSADQGRTALEQLAKLDLKASALPVAGRVKLLQVEALAHLAIGDVRSATERATALAVEAGEYSDAAETAWLISVAAGNAQQAEDAAKQVAKSADGDKKKVLNKRRRQLKAVGRAAPDVRYTTTDERSIAFAERDGGVLVLELWSVRDKLDKPSLAALNKLHADLAGQPKVEFLSLNIDDSSKRDAVTKVMLDRSSAWSTGFAPPAAGGFDLIDAFDAGLAPWQAIIDQHGLVRAIGDLRDAAMQYALRAAHAEARGDFEAVLPVTLSGQQSRPPADLAAEAQEREATAVANAAPPPPGKPSNPEAADLLRQARVFRRTGLLTDAKRIFQEIIDKYPGTYEADEAAQYLSSMP